MYPREIWRGAAPKSSQLYRAVLVEYNKVTFEMFGGKDAMKVDVWKPLDEETDDLLRVAQGMALKLAHEPVAVTPISEKDTF